MEELLQSADFQKILPYLVGVAIFQFLLWLLFANTIRVTLKLIKIENRCLLPSQSWFVALPFFNIYWNFVVVRRLADSLNNEFYDRKIAVEENPTQTQGMWYAGSFMVSNFPLPAFISYLTSISTLIGFIVYWMKINEYKKLLKAPYKRVEDDIQEEENL